MDLALDGKIALVTAASRGIGAAVAAALAAEGAIVMAASRSADNSSTVPGVEHLRLDLADPAAVDEAVATVVERHGRLDILVVNTPGPVLKPIVELDWQSWQAAHDQLLRPAVQLGTSAAQAMSAAGSGVIAFLTSTWVLQPVEKGVLSAAYRSAVSAFAKTLALEVAPRGVRVVHVLPGATETDRMRDIVETKSAANGTTIDDEIREISAGIPLGRWAQAEEIANAVTFAVSPRASFITGSALTVDGGAVRRTA